MKKLTAGIFATLLAVVSADSAYAAIASKGYVDEKVETKADAATVTSLQGTVSGHTSQIGTINEKIAGYGDIVTHDVDEFATAAQGALADTAVQPDDITNVERTTNKTQTVNAQSTETQYPSAKAVWAAVSSVDANASVEALGARVTTAEGEIDTLQTQMAGKANTDDLGALAQLDAVGSAEITDGAVATADIASKAVTKEKLADDIVTSLGRADTALQQASLNGYLTKTAADAAYAGKTLETQVGTVSKENMGTTTATTVVAGVKEAIDAAKAAASAASTADGKAVAAQGAVDTLEETVSEQGTRLTAAEGEIDTIQGQISSMATSDTVTKLTERVTTAEGDITALETAVNDAESGLVATNAIADEALANAATAQKAAEAAQATADKKQDKLTQTGSANQPVYVDATGKVTAGNKIPTVTTTIAAGQTDAAQAGAVATALAAKANSTDVYTKTTANSTFIPRPGTNCTATGTKCVLVTNGTNFEWEVIARGDAEE